MEIALTLQKHTYLEKNNCSRQLHLSKISLSPKYPAIDRVFEKPQIKKEEK
jgi:hypothetical protein